MEKKTSAKDIHKYGTQQDFIEFYKALSKKLGDLPSRIIAGIAAEAFMVLGYFVFEGFLYGFAPSAVNRDHYSFGFNISFSDKNIAGYAEYLRKPVKIPYVGICKSRFPF